MNKTSTMSWLKNRGALALLALAGVVCASPTGALARDDKKADEKPAEAKPAQTGSKLDQYDEKLSNNPDDPAAKVIYRIPVVGNFGLDFSLTPLRKVIADAKKVQPDVIVFAINSEWSEESEYEVLDEWVFGATDTAIQISTMLNQDIANDPSWTKKPNVIAWVRNATGPVAIFPFMCKDIYYTPDTVHGGIRGLEFFRAGQADMVVLEKWRGMVRGRVEGVAIAGGHDPRIIRAMMRRDYTLSYTMVGGKPDFYEDLSGQIVLTDDGDPDAGRADLMEDIARGRGNDILTLRPDVATQIGFIKGVASSWDDLMFELGAQRAYRTFSRRAERVFSDWRRETDKILPRLREIDRERQRVQVEGATASERNRQRARLIKYSEEMIDIVSRYREVVGSVRNERGLNIIQDPDSFIANERADIVQLKAAIRRDRDR